MPTNKRGFTHGVGFFAAGWKLVRTKGIRQFVLVPVLINALVFLALGWFAFAQFDQWMNSLSVLERFGDWKIVEFFATVFRWFAAILIIFVFTYAYTLLANFLAAPFNGLLAERVEAHLDSGAVSEEFNLLALLKSTPGMIWSEVRKLLYLALWMIPLLLLHLIPVVNFVAPFLLFLFGAWMFALEYVDYPMGNHGHGFKKVRKTLREEPSTAIGFGLPVALLSAVPLVNLFVMPVAVAGATAWFVSRQKNANATETTCLQASAP